MYALVEIKGKQYRAEKGSVLEVDLLQQQEGDKVEFDSVLMLRNDDGATFGSPFVSGAKVQAVVEDHYKDDKVVVFKYKKRKRYRRTAGHRQRYSRIRVEDIVAG